MCEQKYGVMIVGQSGGMINAYHFAGVVTHKITVQIPNYNISAEIAGSYFAIDGKWGIYDSISLRSLLGIAEFKSEKSGHVIFGGNGNGIYTSVVFVEAATSITFAAHAAKCRVDGRFIINYWK